MRDKARYYDILRVLPTSVNINCVSNLYGYASSDSTRAYFIEDIRSLSVFLLYKMHNYKFLESMY